MDKIFQFSVLSQMVKLVIGLKQKRFGASCPSDLQNLAEVSIYLGNIFFSTDFSAVASKMNLLFCYRSL